MLKRYELRNRRAELGTLLRRSGSCANESSRGTLLHNALGVLQPTSFHRLHSLDRAGRLMTTSLCSTREQNSG